MAVIIAIVAICIGSRIRERCITERLKRLPVVYNDVRDVLPQRRTPEVQRISRDELYTIEGVPEAEGVFQHRFFGISD